MLIVKEKVSPPTSQTTNLESPAEIRPGELTSWELETATLKLSSAGLVPRNALAMTGLANLGVVGLETIQVVGSHRE